MSDNKAVDPIETAVNEYFHELSFRKLPRDMHQFLLKKLEKPLIINVLRAVRGSQTRAAEVLGMNRNTLRDRCKEYNILACDFYPDPNA